MSRFSTAVFFPLSTCLPTFLSTICLSLPSSSQSQALVLISDEMIALLFQFFLSPLPSQPSCHRNRSVCAFNGDFCVLPWASVFQSIPSAERFIIQTKLGGCVWWPNVHHPVYLCSFLPTHLYLLLYLHAEIVFECVFSQFYVFISVRPTVCVIGPLSPHQTPITHSLAGWMTLDWVFGGLGRP